MSGAKQLVAHGKRVHPQRKKSKVKAWRSAQAAHGYQAASSKAQRKQRGSKRGGHNRAKKASKNHGPPQ